MMMTIRTYCRGNGLKECCHKGNKLKAICDRDNRLMGGLGEETNLALLVLGCMANGTGTSVKVG